MVSDKTFVYLTPMESPVEVTLGSKEAILSVAVYAYPEPELVWYRGDTPIDPQDRHYDVRYGRIYHCKIKMYRLEMKEGVPK